MMAKTNTTLARKTIRQLIQQCPLGTEITVLGWVKTKRTSKNVTFITLQDGSTLAPLQVVIDPTLLSESVLKKITVGASVAVHGEMVASLGKEQAKEVKVHNLEVIGVCPDNYPLQPKRHTLPFLRTIQHLRMRTNTFGAILRIRHALGYAIHTFFHERGFYWLHTPIITSADAEGAGQVFSVVSNAVNNQQSPDSFFGKAVFLTVSGQLAGETGAMGLGKVYTFGPTFRAENSNTTRHLAEFWMVEPEMAFYDLKQTTHLAETCLKEVIHYVLEHCDEDLAFLEARRLHEHKQEINNTLPLAPLRTLLRDIGHKPFIHISYTQVIERLRKASQKKLNKLLHTPVWGEDLSTAHERFLTDQAQSGIVITDYPKDLKAFYMRQNEDGRTVAAFDILLPRVGEVVGGSQREERLDYLSQAMTSLKIDKQAMKWYMDTRRFGTVPHSGFGIGFERLVLLLTGMDNIRDVIPFPRTPGTAMC